MPNNKISVDLDRLRDLHSKNYSFGRICEEMGHTRTTIVSRLYELGLVKKQSTKVKELVESEVRQMYLEENLSFAQISDRTGCSKSGVRKYIIRLGILRKCASNQRVRKVWRKFTLTKEQLYEKFIVQQMTDTQIGRELGVSLETVYKWRMKWGIERDVRIGQADLPKDDLQRMYCEEKLTMQQIADKFGIKIGVVDRNIKMYGLAIDGQEMKDRRLERNSKRFRKEILSGSGYRMIKIEGHPTANLKGYVARHRYVIEQAIGRHLMEGELVHHINEIRLDNRIENLALIPTNKLHTTVHRYMNKLCVYLLGMTKDLPHPVKFDAPIFWGGRYIAELNESGPWPSQSEIEYFSKGQYRKRKEHTSPLPEQSTCAEPDLVLQSI